MAVWMVGKLVGKLVEKLVDERGATLGKRTVDYWDLMKVEQ